jgi:serine protease Do
MKKTTAVVCMSLTVLLSFVAGFCGAYLSGIINKQTETAAINEFFTERFPLPEFEDELPLDWATLTHLASGAPYAQRKVLTIPEIARAVADTVVEIETELLITNSRFGQFISSGAGSGVIIQAEGYIVTCDHVIADATKITVRLRSGDTYSARVVGRDMKSDLAVVKIEAKQLTAAQFGNSSALVVGELAVAIGNPLGSLGGTVTEGIISALGREIKIDGETMNLLQTSAAVNSGNSGGGLFNAYGELIGVVNAKPRGADIEGIGFAIPSGAARDIVSQLMRYGYVQGRVDFGITLVDIADIFTAMRYGVSGTGVYVGRPDDDSGLKAGDRIISVNGITVRTSADVKAVYEKFKVGDTLSLVISRGGRNYDASVVLKQAKY